MDSERERLIRAFAKAEVSWRSLQDGGFSNYLEVLAGLEELGLSPPIAEMTGPNVESHQRAMAIIHAQLQNCSKTPDDTQENLTDVLASGERIAKRDAEALRLLGE